MSTFIEPSHVWKTPLGNSQNYLEREKGNISL